MLRKLWGGEKLSDTTDPHTYLQLLFQAIHHRNRECSPERMNPFRAALSPVLGTNHLELDRFALKSRPTSVLKGVEKRAANNGRHISTYYL